MRRFAKWLLSSVFLVMVAGVQAAPVQSEAKAGPARVTLETTQGDIVIELDSEKAPVTVKNFLDYVNRGFYDGLVFHRVIKNFMIQGGGFSPDMNQKKTEAPIKNESMMINSLKNERGTIAMARTQIPDSATSQFFINLVDNYFLDGDRNKPGYAVFGHVVEGMSVVDGIARVKTGRRSGHGHVPMEPVVIKKSYVTGKAVDKKAMDKTLQKKAS